MIVIWYFGSCIRTACNAINLVNWYSDFARWWILEQDSTSAADFVLALWCLLLPQSEWTGEITDFWFSKTSWETVSNSRYFLALTCLKLFLFGCFWSLGSFDRFGVACALCFVSRWQKLCRKVKPKLIGETFKRSFGHRFKMWLEMQPGFQFFACGLLSPSVVYKASLEVSARHSWHSSFWAVTAASVFRSGCAARAWDLHNVADRASWHQHGGDMSLEALWLSLPTAKVAWRSSFGSGRLLVEVTIIGMERAFGLWSTRNAVRSQSPSKGVPHPLHAFRLVCPICLLQTSCSSSPMMDQRVSGHICGVRCTLLCSTRAQAGTWSVVKSSAHCLQQNGQIQRSQTSMTLHVSGCLLSSVSSIWCLECGFQMRMQRFFEDGEIMQCSLFSPDLFTDFSSTSAFAKCSSFGSIVLESSRNTALNPSW